MEDKTINLVSYCSKSLVDKQKQNLIIETSPTNPEKLDKISVFNNTYWENYLNKKNDYLYLENLYNRFSNIFFSKLNKVHNTNHDDKYWGILTSHWLLTIIQVLWYKWVNLNEVQKIYPNIVFKYIKYSNEDLIPTDTFDLRTKKSPYSSFWNHIVYSDIARNSNSFKFNIIELSMNIKKKQIKKIIFNDRKQFFLKNIIDNFLLIFFKKRTLLLHDSYFNFFDRFKLEKKFNQFPINFNLFKKKIKFEYNELNIPDRESLNFSEFNPTNDFEDYLKKRLKNFIPYSFIEGYGFLKQHIKKIDMSPKLILTANAHINNDFFNLWAAESVNNGTKYIVSDHGSYLMDFLNFNVWTQYYDNHATWIDWLDKANSKNTKLPCQIIKKIKININKVNKNKQILFSYKNQPGYFFKISNGFLPSQTNLEFERLKKFFVNLESPIKKKICIRNPFEDVFQINKKFRNYYKFKISKEKNFYSDLEKSSLSIINYPETAFIKSISSNIPTIMILDPDFWKIPERYIPIYKKLEEEKIVFYDFKLASDHLNLIYDNPYEWWHSHNVKETLNEFKKLFCSYDNKSYLHSWERYLKSFI